MRICQLDNGTTTRYHAAYPLNSVAEVSPGFSYLGTGTIFSVNGNPYGGKTRFRFFISKGKK